VCGDFFAVRVEGDQRGEDEARGEIDDDDQKERAAVSVFAVFGGVDGPCV
jgi:hypothetical protein